MNKNDDLASDKTTKPTDKREREREREREKNKQTLQVKDPREFKWDIVSELPRQRKNEIFLQTTRNNNNKQTNKQQQQQTTTLEFINIHSNQLTLVFVSIPIISVIVTVDEATEATV